MLNKHLTAGIDEFTQADKERFQDPVQYMQFRRGIEMESNVSFYAELMAA